jgi:CelD/BcsL family acetyltransferase involved in cellulose biosynthesis
MRVEVYTEADGFAILVGEWNELLKRSTVDTVFLTWEWQTTWWSCLGQGDLLLIAVRDDEDRLIGLAPLYRLESETGERRLAVVGCAEVSDYLDIIAAVGHEAAVYAAVLDSLEGEKAPSWDVAIMCNIPGDSPTFSLMKAMAEERGYGTWLGVQDVCPVIPLPTTWDEYLASLDKKQRHEIRRKVRKAERQARVHWYIVDEEHGLAPAVEAFLELHQKSSAGKEDFMDEQMKDFFRAMCRIMARRGWLQLSFIELNGHKAASMLSFDYGDEILVYNSGYDPESYAHLSPGIVLLAYCIEHAIDLGRARFDFLRGDEVYKYRFGARETNIYRLILSK